MPSEQGPVASPQEVKKDLLGLDEGWKNEWLRPPEPIALTPKPQTPLSSQDNSDIELTSEVKIEDEENVVDDKREEQSDDKKAKAMTTSRGSIKEESSDETLDKRSKRQSGGKEIPYEKIFIKNYKSISEKPEPLTEINNIFKENPLPHEKQIFHQKILNRIVKNLDNPKQLAAEYIAYIRKAAEIEIFSCTLCEYQTIHKENLKSHLLLLHKKEPEEKKFKCLFRSCFFKAKNLGGLRNHQLIHNEPVSDIDSPSDTEPLSSFLSDNENEKKPKKKKYKNKPRRRTEEEKARYECDICDIQITGRDAFIQHNKTHKDPNRPKRYVCHICQYGATKLLVKKHLLKVHNIETKGVHEMKKHKCPQCDYITDIKSCLNSHIIIHKNPDEVTWYKCTFCSFTTKHRVSWKNHMKFHEPNQEERKKFMCDVCSKSFIKKQNLDGHMLIHRSIDEVSEIYKCPECSYQTKFKCHLITHKQKHQEAKYICDVCGFRTRRQGSYKMHCRLHKDKSEIEIFKCSLCPYETRFKHDLRKHTNSSIHSILAKRASAQANADPNKKKRKKRSKKKKEDSEAKNEEPEGSRQPPIVEQRPLPIIDDNGGLANRARLDEDMANRQRHNIDDGVASRLFYQFSLLNAQMQ